MRRPCASGFTLIELLVVIGIIGILSTALMTGLSSGHETGLRGIDRIVLQAKYQDLLKAWQDGKRLPPEGGHEFVYYPWVSGSMQRSKSELRSMFVSESMSPRLAEMLREDTRTVLTRYEDIDSDDTDWAGRAAGHYRSRMFLSAHEALLATDNEHGPTYSDGSVHVLMGDGTVETIRPEDIPEAEGDPDYVIQVGPDSDVPVLRTLAR